MQPSDPHGVIAAAELVAAHPQRVDEARLRDALSAVQRRKAEEHGAWRDAEVALLGALGAKRKAEVEA